ncbi:MAG: hypothetical protein A3H68_00430 [Candidatus Taylorbacteria bacterium RIFCSPLOWO2_02_FULL_46_40]|uniref:Type II toxin-antitoxin system HicA family toxin n=1 Tax=Candidatus Taylorbacteria bacterium RIFCSPLOWO2_02_FULL_46_40 TaxID=1802329 RepID=A0A1G2P2B6_9BACT|nr:MAG: hypothetical protein A3H68_00430 [Candidatus Taylorbacteria bacterium RIFCSPLOWO2_02_FULL_46_40]
MPKLRVISGKETVKIFEDLGFMVDVQKGSHIKLKRINVSGIKQVLAIPNHKEIDRGTLKAIINQASQYIPEAELRKFFYN